jgi:hypothetical protein
MHLLHSTKEPRMENNENNSNYETPRIEDHGNLTELTAAGHLYGNFDANYTVGQPIPKGGAGTSTTP